MRTRIPTLLTLAVAALLACGGADSDLAWSDETYASGLPEDELLSSSAQELQSATGPGQLVHWQLNTDRGVRTVFPGYTPINFVKRMKQYRFAPDLIAAQECDEYCACGPDNYDAKAKTCAGPPKKGSLLYELNTLLAEPYAVISAPDNTSIYFRASRFELTKKQTFSSYQTGCGMTATLVLLHDKLNPGRYVAAMSEHIGNIPTCLVTRIAWADEKIATWAAELGTQPSFVFVSGDWNMRVDSTSSTEAKRRAELKPDCWWRKLTRASDGTCGPGVSDYLDVMEAKHEGGGTYSATRPVCSQFTFNNPASKVAGAERCDTQLGSGVLWRIDYTLARGTSAHRENIVSALTDQGYLDVNGDGNVDGGGEKYSGHRALYTRVRY